MNWDKNYGCQGCGLPMTYPQFQEGRGFHSGMCEDYRKAIAIKRTQKPRERRVRKA